MANRTSAKSNIITKNVPTVTNAILTDMLNNDIIDNVEFKEDVAVAQSSGASNITIDFTGKDRVDLTRTGGALNITLSGISDGETKFLLITKTAGQAVSFVGVTDITPIKANANALSIVLYEIVRKSSYYFAKAWVESVKTATDTIEGVLETATQAESNALSATDKIITPGRQPITSQSQKGLVQMATQTEANALTDLLKAIAPGTIPLATSTQKGIIRTATAAENDAGTAGSLAVIASELKRKLDALSDIFIEADDISLAQSGYLDLSIGLQFRWGKVVSTSDDYETHTFVKPFSNACFALVADLGAGQETELQANNFAFNRLNEIIGTHDLLYFAIGY